jgi:hypothetical protein
MVSQSKKSLNRRKGCQCLSLSKFWGLPEWIAIGIGAKSGKGCSKSLISQSLNDSTASSEANKALFSFWSAVESSGIEEAI